VGTQFKDSQPTFTTTSDYGFDGTALIVSTFTADQVQPIGKVFTLSDGSTLTFLSADPNTGATVRVQRSDDKEPPIATDIQPDWISKPWNGKLGEGNIFKNEIGQWDYPTAEIPLDAITDNRLVKTIQVEVNGQIVGQVDQPMFNGIKTYTFKSTKPGTYIFRLIATDYAGLSTSTPTETLTSSYFQLEESFYRVKPAKDPKTSFVLVVLQESKDRKYVLENLSSGKIESIVLKKNWYEYTITNISRNQKFTARLTVTDEMGYTDGGSEIEYEPARTVCSNTKCFVGSQWNVETGFWGVGAGNMTLQERIGGKWVNIQTTRPVSDPKGKMKNYVTYVMRIEYKTPGKHTYRLLIAESKKYSGQITSTFTQVVSAP
jgi:hypothetical protein